MFAHADIEKMQFPNIFSSSSIRPAHRVKRDPKEQNFVCQYVGVEREKNVIENYFPLNIDEDTLYKFQNISLIIGNFFGISSDIICGSRQAKSLKMPRALWMFFCIQYTNATYAQIGQYCANRRPESVRRQCIWVQKMMHDYSLVLSISKDISLEIIVKLTNK